MRSIRIALGGLALWAVLMFVAPALAQVSFTPVPPAAVGVNQITGPTLGNNGQ